MNKKKAYRSHLLGVRGGNAGEAVSRSFARRSSDGECISRVLVIKLTLAASLLDEGIERSISKRQGNQSGKKVS